MKRDIVYKAKCRALLMDSIYMLLEGQYLYEGKFKEVFENFVNDNANAYSKYLEIMYDINSNEYGIKSISDNLEMDELFLKYLYGNRIELYDEVDIEDIKLISKLAEEYLNYICYLNIIKNESKTTIKH